MEILRAKEILKKRPDVTYERPLTELANRIFNNLNFDI